jgi:hypothetical protein
MRIGWRSTFDNNGESYYPDGLTATDSPALAASFQLLSALLNIALWGSTPPNC